MEETLPETSAGTEGRTSPLELLCIGNPLIDAFATADESFALRWELNEAVQHINMEKLSAILKALPEASGSGEFTICSGGGAANVAKIAGLLGISTGFTGSAGSDEYAAIFEKEMIEAGVLTRLVRKPSPTGVCLMLRINRSRADGGLKTAASPSAALEFSEDDLDEGLIRSAKVVVLDGFMLGREALVRRIFALADKHGTVVALDLSAANLASERAHEIVTYARVYPLILFMNEDEAKAFYRALRQSRKENADDDEEGLNPDHIALFKTFTANDIFPILAVKLGSKGAVVFAGGSVFREGTVPLKPVDATGAGDAFCAAFLGAWIRDKSLSDCAALGNKAAREVLNVHGAKADAKALKNLGKQFRR